MTQIRRELGAEPNPRPAGATTRPDDEDAWLLPCVPMISMWRWASPLATDRARTTMPSTDTVYLFR